MSEFQEAIIAADGALINGLKNDVAELKKTLQDLVTELEHANYIDVNPYSIKAVKQAIKLLARA